MQVGHDSRQVARENIQLRRLEPFSHAVLFTSRGDRFIIFGRVEVRDVARVEDVVDVLEHGLEDDLRVAEQEHGRLVLDAGVEQDLLEGLAPACVMS